MWGVHAPGVWHRDGGVLNALADGDMGQIRLEDVGYVHGVHCGRWRLLQERHEHPHCPDGSIR